MLPDSPTAADFLHQFDAPVCPYTGLRTFTEDEAVYFRGREAHIGRCVELLADQHFVMITGASGDGKSSLVYAGLLPEIRAGFFRAKYSNWAVCTFRPERQPLRQMARAVAAGLHLSASAEAVESELSQGFSALVQLYQNSQLVPAAALPGQPELPEAERRRQRSESANLLLVVDQFEEFFTNAENYDGAAPNAQAKAVVNLLLETTRLAREQNLPIYIVCTMRSDYIGQCADFRGLVELIGESQYFVPRLLRAEFVEIIREPAHLSGNRIAERLVQRLVNDNRDGRDQLPVLQHALYCIWLAAQRDREELDLVHYAMVGGLPPDEVPRADQPRFAEWRRQLSAEQEARLLASPSLHNVLDAHANQLFAEAAATYNRDFTPALPPATAERIIELTFRSLTRVDAGRVVRNRITGAEITAIINDPTLPWPVVCRVLRPFRQPGTTFLSPFLSEGDDDQAVLPPDTVLDITHESLIRNWQRLAAWAQDEAQDVQTLGQLATQAAAWADNAENKGYLLPIGPYSQFARWYARKQPNANWLAYYVADGGQAPQRQEVAETQSQLLGNYLKSSRQSLRFSLVLAKHGAKRLALWVLGPLVLMGLLWGGWEWRQRQADYVAYTVVRDQMSCLQSPYIFSDDKVDFIVNAHRLRNFTYQSDFWGTDSNRYSFPKLLDDIHSDTLALDCELLMYKRVTNVGYDSVVENALARQVLFDLDKRLNKEGSLLTLEQGRPTPTIRQRQLAVRTAQTILALTHYLSYTDPHPLLAGRPHRLARLDNAPLYAIKQRLLMQLSGYMRREVSTLAGSPPRPVTFWFCTQVLLGQSNFSIEDLEFLNRLNPLEPASQAQFARFYPQHTELKFGRGSLSSRGLGFQTFMLIAAALRQPNQLEVNPLLACADSLAKYAAGYNDDCIIRPILPYLLKYPVSLPLAYELCKRSHAKVVPAFALLTYSLLSATPDNSDWEPIATTPNVKPLPTFQNVYTDRVSYSIPLQTRDKCWPVLGKLLQQLAYKEQLFYLTVEGTDGMHEKNVAVTENSLFLEAFYLKYKGIYFCEVNPNLPVGLECFKKFDDVIQRLHLTQKKPHLVKSGEWNGVIYSIDLSDALDFLQYVGRPGTVNSFRTNTLAGGFFLSAFTQFYQHRLLTLAVSPTPNPHQLRALDSLVFLESALSGRYTMGWTIFDTKLDRSAEAQPDIDWVRRLQQVKTSGDPDRPARNAFLLKLLTTTQHFTSTTSFDAERDIVPYGRTLAKQPPFAQEPLQIALSDLAVVAAAHGQLADAFAVANLLPEPLLTATKIRIGEQAMLHNLPGNLKPLDDFLRQYGQRIRAHPDQIPLNIVQVLSWRGNEFQDLVDLLMREGSMSTVGYGNGIGSVCLGYTLAGKSSEAVKLVPPYVWATRQLRYYGKVLNGLAYTNRNAQNDGWQEYDEAALTAPHDY